MRQSFCFLGLAGVFVILLVLSLSPPSRTKSQPSEEQMEHITQDIQEGYSYAIQKRFKDAQESFKKVLAQQPENAAAHNNLGNLYLLTGKYASAMQQYWDALRDDQTDTNIYLNLGIVYYLQMEITPSEGYVGAQELRITKDDWKACSDNAFDKAFENFRSAADACLRLEIPRAEVPEYNWVQKLLCEAAERCEKSSELRPGGGRSRNEWKIPVYWKTQ